VTETRRRFLPAEIVSDPGILGGIPCFRGTRVPAETIRIMVADGCSKREIFEHYPSLPTDFMDALQQWESQRAAAE